MAFQLDHIIDSGPLVDSTKLALTHSSIYVTRNSKSLSLFIPRAVPMLIWFSTFLHNEQKHNGKDMQTRFRIYFGLLRAEDDLGIRWVLGVLCVCSLSYACTLNWGYKFRLVTHEQQHRTPNKSLCTVQLNGKGERARDCPKCLLGFHFYFILFHFFPPLFSRESSHEEKLALIYIADEYKWKNV